VSGSRAKLICVYLFAFLSSSLCFYLSSYLDNIHLYFSRFTHFRTRFRGAERIGLREKEHFKINERLRRKLDETIASEF